MTVEDSEGEDNELQLSRHSDNGIDAEVRTADGGTMFVQVKGYRRRDGTYVRPHLSRMPRRRRPASHRLLTILVRQSGRAASGLTDLAVFLAGRKRVALRDEWRAHLAGESGRDPASWRKVKQASGFLISAVRYRYSDIANAVWALTDAVLRSRTLSNVVVVIPTAAAEYLVLRRAGTLGVVMSAESTGMIGGTMYGLIRTGSGWRNVKPPEPKARRAKE